MAILGSERRKLPAAGSPEGVGPGMGGVAGGVAERGRPWILRTVVAALLLASALVGPAHRDFTALPVADHCGVERWAVKTGTDSAAGQVDLTSPKTTTVDALRSLTPPTHWGNSLARIQPTETTVWVITAFFTAYAPEADSDYHLAVADEQGRTMIVEIPSPDCVGSQSPFLSGIQRARDQFDAA